MVVVFLLPLFFFSQNTIYSEDFNNNTHTSPNNLEMDKVLISQNGDYLYSVRKNSHIGVQEIFLVKYKISDGKTAVIKLLKTPEIKSLFNASINSFEIIENKLIILTSNNIFIFNYHADNFKLEVVLKNEKSFNKIFKLNSSEMLLYVNYNFHPMDEVDKHTWAKLDLASNLVVGYKKMDDSNAIFTYFVNEWISTYKGVIAYSHSSDYKIIFYDHNFYPIDSIISDQFKNNGDKMGYLPTGNDHSSDEMYKIRKADDTLLSRIQKIFLLDSAHLLAIIKLPNTKNMNFNLWQKKDGSWNLLNTGTLPSYYENGKKYDKTNNSITGFYGNGDGLIYHGNFEFYFMYFPYIENITTSSFDRKKDYDDKITEKMRKKELYYGVKKIKILTK